MIVLKFGGTSVRNAEWIDKAIDIARQQLDRAPVLVSSAMGKTTDKIIQIFTSAESGHSESAFDSLEKLKDEHFITARAILTGERLEKAQTTLDLYFGQFFSLIKGLTLLKDCSPRSRDALLSYGERLATLLIALRAQERGINVSLLDSRNFIRTNNDFNNAQPLMELTYKKIRELVIPEAGRLLVTQGFIASTRDGVTTTLGRGGSDYSAAIIGAALDAEEVQIWTDVNGIMTSDPRVIEGVRTVPHVTYTEAGELAYFGAKVVHPATIQPAVKNNIPVLVKNTGEPAHPGTSIQAHVEKKGLKAIAGKKKVLLINISSSRMLNAYGFLNKIFAIFEKHETPVDLVSTSEVSVSMTIENTDNLNNIVSDLRELGQVNVERDMGIVCLVGQGLWMDSAFITKIFSSLENVPIKMLSLGSSDVNLSLVVPQERVDMAIQQLHDKLLKK